MARKRTQKPKKAKRIRSPKLADVVSSMANADFFDYRLMMTPNGVLELSSGHTDLRQGLHSVETLCEELRSANYPLCRELMVKAVSTFNESDERIMRGLSDLEDYFSDHPDEVREIFEGLKEMSEGRRTLMKALQALDETRTGEALGFSRHALAHLRDAAHRVGGQIREIKERCPAGFEYEAVDLKKRDK